MKELAQVLVFPSEGFVILLIKENEWLVKHTRLWTDFLIYSKVVAGPGKLAAGAH